MPYLHLSLSFIHLLFPPTSFTFPSLPLSLPSPSSLSSPSPFSPSPLPLGEEIMQRLLDNMFSSETPSDSVIVNGIAVILTILEKRCSSTLCCYGNNSETAWLPLLPLPSLVSFSLSPLPFPSPSPLCRFLLPHKFLVLLE